MKVSLIHIQEDKAQCNFVVVVVVLDPLIRRYPPECPEISLFQSVIRVLQVNGGCIESALIAHFGRE